MAADSTDIYAGLARVVNTQSGWQRQHSYDDYGYYILEVDHGNPEPKAVVVDVPYADHQLNFTRWHGRVFHKTRTISFTFARKYPTSTARTAGRDEFVAWLWDIQGEVVQDDTLRNYPYWYDMCCTSVTTEENPLGGLVTVKAEFSVYPYHAVSASTTLPATDGTGLENWRL